VKLVAAEGLAGGPRESVELVTEVAVGELAGEEECLPELLLRGQPIFAPQVPVVLGIEGGEEVARLECGDGLGHGQVGEGGVGPDRVAEERREGGLVDRALAQAGDHARPVRHAHLDGVERRAPGLAGQVRLPAVVELAPDVHALGVESEPGTEPGIGGGGGIAVADGFAVVAQ
jgi:hypothetical protein